MNEKEPSPEQLLKLLEIQMQNSRNQREKKTESRTAFRVMAIVILLVLLMGSLWVLMMLAEDMPRPKNPGAADRPAAKPVPAQNK